MLDKDHYALLQIEDEIIFLKIALEKLRLKEECAGKLTSVDKSKRRHFKTIINLLEHYKAYVETGETVNDILFSQIYPQKADTEYCSVYDYRQKTRQQNLKGNLVGKSLKAICKRYGLKYLKDEYRNCYLYPQEAWSIYEDGKRNAKM